MLPVGVLALQGDFAEHIAALRRLGVEARDVRTPTDLERLSALIIPGGESTTISGLMRRWELSGPIGRLARMGMPMWGTCAGLIIMARGVIGNPVSTLDLLDVDVQRNAYGRQIDSFESPVPVPALGLDPFHAVFIRAPVIRRVGPGVTVLAKLQDGTPVAVQQGHLLGSSFHPELTDDGRFHAYLARLAETYSRTRDVASV